MTAAFLFYCCAAVSRARQARLELITLWLRARRAYRFGGCRGLFRELTHKRRLQGFWRTQPRRFFLRVHLPAGPYLNSPRHWQTLATVNAWDRGEAEEMANMIVAPLGEVATELYEAENR